VSGKNQVPIIFNWQSTNPATGFLPANNPGGTAPSKVLAGAMASTNTIYSQIIESSRMDNLGLEVTWTGTPTGTFQVMYSNSGLYFYALTFNPALTQPNGSVGGYLVSVNQQPFKWLMLEYTNATGTGSLYVYGQQKDLN
jgi:hypothetical protein